MLDSKFEIWPSDHTDSDVLIILESRGGSGSKARNRDYGPQLSHILRTLQLNDCIIPRVELLSRVARKNLKSLSLDLPYPLLSDKRVDIEDVRRMIQRAQVTKGQKPGASGGNGTKRIGIYVKTGNLVAIAGVKTLLV